jgi:flagellar biosynthesis protein FlhB
MVQQEEVQNTLQSEYYRVKEFASFKRIYRNPNLFNFPKLTLKNIIFYQSPKFYFQKNRTEIGKNLKINKINHSNFNRTDFL